MDTTGCLLSDHEHDFAKSAFRKLYGISIMTLEIKVSPSLLVVITVARYSKGVVTY